MVTRTAITYLLCVTVVCVNGFLPNRMSPMASTSDFTHQDITEIAILRSVAEMFEETSWRIIRPGELTGIPNITAKSLFDRYYGGTVSEKLFQEAIDDIVKANNRVDQDHYSESAWHVNGEAIKEGNDKITLLRETAINVLNKTNPNLDAARDLIGQFLHIVQMFYSNTNWLELNGTAVYESLGIRGKPLVGVAPPSLDTCRSCGGRSGVFCTDNVLVQNELTSGYRSGQDRSKPSKDPQTHQTGKCSHGGPLDTSSTTSAATGGINKDSSDPNISPHYYLHHQAAEGAIRHTKFFLDDPVYGLRTWIGNTTFRALFNIAGSIDMVLVIDTSHTMADDIQALRRKMQEIITETAGTIKQPESYIIVTFNNLGNTTHIFQSANGTEVMKYLHTIHVTDIVGNCPTYALTAILAAATVAKPNSNIYVYTDRSPKDADMINYVTDIVTHKKIGVAFVLTGDCSGRSSRQTARSRPRRSAGMDLYGGLAASSGGSVYHTDKGGVAKMADIIKESVTTSATTILKLDVAAPSQNKVFDIPVDATIKEVTIKIIADSIPEPVDTLKNPSGTPIPMIPGTFATTTVKELGGGVRLIKIKAPTPGVWHLTKKDSVRWALEVTAQSTIDFSTKFVQTNPLNGFQYEITGRPIAGAKATVVITVPSIDKIKGIDRVVLTDSAGKSLDSSPLTQGRGRAASMFKGSFTLPTKAFQVSITGADILHFPVQRLDPTRITPIAIKLDIGTLPGSLYVDESLKIPYTVSNRGDSKTAIKVDIKDDLGFAVNPTEKTFNLDGGANATGTFTIHAGHTDGVTTTVTLSAEPDGVSTHSPQYDTRRVTVERHVAKKVDNTTPECNVTSVTGSCSMAQMDPCSCHLHTWSGTAQFGDVGFGLFQISSTVGTTGTFTYDNFTLGHTIDKGAKTASIGSDCCHPESYINVVDMASNTAQCTFDLAPGLTKPVYDCTTTTTTTTIAPSTTTTMTTSPSTTTTMTTTTTPTTSTLKSVVTSASATKALGLPKATTVGSAIRNTDHTPPVCNVTSTHGHCSPSQTSSDDCDQHVWFGTVQFGDEGSGLYLVESTAGDSSVLNHDKFAEGDTLSSGLKTGTLTSTCCHPLTYIVVIDVAGNEGQCEFDVTDTQVTDEPYKLSTGAIAGISVGVVAAVVGMVVAAVLITKYGKCSSVTPSSNTGRFRTTAWD
ncbi:von Willebrand factor A domain-containing protein 7-like [Haliotis cracherodii]|uniref:von Willebrand factor A domain-containing protein 7-like n=1 Tax=Haliotis cracherodii TaxID=6455 RepID=UPI0039E8FD88